MQKRKIHPSPIIENQLYDDEELMWEGRPNPMRFIRNADWFGVVFGLGFAAFAVFFISMALQMFDPTPAFGGFSRRSGPPPAFKLFFLAIPTVFIFVGLRQAAEPILKFIEGRGTTYALTNKRAFIVTQTWSTWVWSYYDEQIDRITTRMHMDGTGDVIFSSRKVTQRVHQGRQSYQRTISKEEGFIGIYDAREVEDLMSQIFFDGEGKSKSKAKVTSTTKGYTQSTAAQLEDRFGTPDQWKQRTQNKSATATLTLREKADLRDLKAKSSLTKPSQTLIDKGYVSVSFVGPREEEMYSITPEGEKALEDSEGGI